MADVQSPDVVAKLAPVNVQICRERTTFKLITFMKNKNTNMAGG
jgi:hypothetical protein